jgi:uncharacterized protein (DUF2147 family)
VRAAITAAALLGTLLAAAPSAAPAGSVEGSWLTEAKNGIVAIFHCGGAELCGRLAWVRIAPSDDNPHAVDNRNPDPKLRRRALCGLTMMWGFRPDGPDHWSGGALYDPQSGNTYRGTMVLRPDGKLGLRGYVLVPLFGRSESWTRFTRPIPPCPTRTARSSNGR